MNQLDLISKLGLQTPIIQAPMAGVATPELAAAVSNAGGLGSLGLGASSMEQARDMISATRALTDKPFNVNVFCHKSAQFDAAREEAWIRYFTPQFARFGATPPTSLSEVYTSFLDDQSMQFLMLAQQPAVLSFHFGIPDTAFLTAVKAAGIITMATATSLREAKVLEQAGIDVIIAQGIEAGGHRGIMDSDGSDEQLSTAVLTRLLVKKCHTPIVAAGGIMDGQGARAMLDLGAVAAQMGTAFILCPESSANTSYRENLRSDRAASTRLTPVMSGRPARGMLNELIQWGEAEGAPAVPSYPLTYDLAKQLNAAAVAKGNYEFAAQWAGQGAPLAREMSAAQLLRTIAKEMA
ncbi:NAD(P)H-dependent flavin oxidoreductase [Paenalcaligenes sp. Me131]|uniref:NAD(P)H-dependent flavin oxidoreductase n=1 Tax=Paenalcaligenes sp. Me131 TaxID=3392636 RepID=UPI003D2A1849